MHRSTSPHVFAPCLLIALGLRQPVSHVEKYDSQELSLRYHKKRENSGGWAEQPTTQNMRPRTETRACEWGQGALAYENEAHGDDYAPRMGGERNIAVYRKICGCLDRDVQTKHVRGLDKWRPRSQCNTCKRPPLCIFVDDRQPLPANR